jgi:hypothetical protein
MVSRHDSIENISSPPFIRSGGGWGRAIFLIYLAGIDCRFVVSASPVSGLFGLGAFEIGGHLAVAPSKPNGDYMTIPQFPLLPSKV